jgi:chromosome segregation protein
VVRDQVAVQTEEQRKREQERGARLSEVTEKRVHLAELRQAADGLAAQREGLRVRMAELESLIHDRRKGLLTYHSRIEEMARQIEEARTRVQPIEETLRQHQETLSATRQQRESMTGQLQQMEEELRGKRAALDDLRTRRSHRDVEVAEQRMRRQNTVERIAQEYHLTPEEMENEPPPVWENDQKPERDTLETLIAELRTKLDSMGPVNLVAIEEHQELEERLNFLTTQQDDLVKAKEQLMEMIRRINRTTTEMFTNTFNQVNEHFQETFKILFGGGSAKLVLVNDEDILESGIEIIARPPGKKLQTVSLLSGGERTMTAVALLFALYIVKPSPFCVLDELDAALDDSNINRFVLMLEGFLKTSQFIVITHNRQTIEAADALYGVTMEKHGISKIVSVRFHKHPEHEKTSVVQTGSTPEEPAPPAGEPAPAPEPVDAEPAGM